MFRAIDYRDYPAYLRGFAAGGLDAPEQNPACLERLVAAIARDPLIDGWMPQLLFVDSDIPLALTHHGGSYLDFFANLFASHPVVSSVHELSANAACYLDQLGALGLEPALRTDTFVPDIPLSDETRRRLAWLNSPVCKLYASREQFLASLTGDRRGKIRRKLRHLANCEIRLSWETLSPPEYAWVLERLERRWMLPGSGDKEDFALAKIQFVWAAVVSETVRQTLWTFVHDERGELAALGYFIRKGDRLVYQGMARRENGPSDLGLFVLYETCVRAKQANDTLSILDPTCKTSTEAMSIDVYKRGVVNTDDLKPIINMTASSAPDLAPPYYSLLSGWVAPEVITPLYEGV